MTKSSSWIRFIRAGVVTYIYAVVAQILTAGAGLIFVNLLTKEEFALFAVFTAFQHALVAQSDLGTLGAVGYFYREHDSWTSFKSVALPSIIRIRIQFFAFAGLVLIVLFMNSGVVDGIALSRKSELLGITIGTACLGMVNALQTTALRVRGHVNTSVAIDASASFLRLALAGGMISFHLMSAEVALITTLLSTMLSFVMGRAYIPEIPLGFPRQYDKNAQHKVRRYILPLIPGSIYYALQPSILIWLSAFFGNAQRIAEVGAVSRIGQIIAFLGFGLNLFVLPYLASLRDDKAFRRSYLSIWAILCILASLVFVSVALSTGIILLLLGPKYSNLDQEVILVTGIALVHIAINYTVIVNRIRGWNKVEPLMTIAQFVTQVFLIAVLPLDSTSGILIFGLYYAVATVLITLGINMIGFLRPDWVVISYHKITDVSTEQSPSSI